MKLKRKILLFNIVKIILKIILLTLDKVEIVCYTSNIKYKEFKKGELIMTTLKDGDGNIWNVKLKIENSKLYAYNTSDYESEPYEINLTKDNIDIILKD